MYQTTNSFVVKIKKTSNTFYTGNYYTQYLISRHMVPGDIIM